MTRQHAARAMTDLAGAIHPHGPIEVVRNIVVPPLGAVIAGMTRGRTLDQAVVPIGVPAAGRNARDSVEGRCWRRRSRGCRSPPFPMT